MSEVHRREGQEKFSFCHVLKLVMIQIMYVVRSVLDAIIDKCFSLYYNDSEKETLPGVSHPFLMESAVSLADRIRRKEISSTVVVQGFIDRIKQVNPALNAVVCNRFELALKEAKDVDDYLSSEDVNISDLKEKKPFYGVPFTTKDSTAAKGLLHTCGLISRRSIKAEEDAEAVTLMKNAGAILIGTTNVPELNLWCETRNNVFGQTCNPYNTTRTTGGSSGGEASIIAACGSPLGLGSDIGGSIRMPAFFCGIFGHKPTTGLTPMKGFTFRTGKEEHTMVCAGPMCKYAQDLAPFLKLIVGDKISKLQLNTEVSVKDIHFYYMDSSKDPRASCVNSDMRKALHSAVNYFEKVSKFPIQKVDISEMKYSSRLWRYWMSKEPTVFAEDLANRKGAVSVWEELPKKLLGKSDFTLAAILNLLDKKLPQEKADWAEKCTKSLEKCFQDLLRDNGVFLYPSHPSPASYHYSSFLRPYNFSYCSIFNVLRLPVTQIPMGLNKNGLPVGVQVVAGPYMDHLCFAVAKELQEAFGGWVPPFQV